MFLVAEVRPFTDGNGRVGREMMNAELVAGHQAKIIVPTGFRSDGRLDHARQRRSRPPHQERAAAELRGLQHRTLR
jgi:hypothetical protein